MKAVLYFILLFAFQVNGQINQVIEIDWGSFYVSEIIEHEEKILLASNYGTPSTFGGAIIQVESDSVDWTLYPNFPFGVYTWVEGDTRLYNVGMKSNRDSLKLQEIDPNTLEVLSRYSYKASENFTLTGGSVRIEDTIYIVTVNRTDDYNVVTGGEYLELWKLGLDGQVYKTITLNRGMRGSYAFKMTVNEDNSLLISSKGLHYHKSGIYHSLLKLDSDGTIIWHYIGDNEVYAAPTKVTTLTDGTILAAYPEDQDFPNWDFTYDDKPVRVDWISQDGELIKRRLYANTRTNRIELDDIEASLDGGAFIFGKSYEEGNSSRSAWLVKIDSEGDTLWSGFYTHPDYSPAERYSYNIADIIERADSSVLVLASFKYPGGQVFPWVFELDADGCHDSTICSNPVLVDHKDVEVSSVPLDLYPNPASDFIILDQVDRGDHVIMVNSMGEQVIDDLVNMPSAQYRIDIKAFPKGLYYVFKTSSLGQRHVGKVVKY